MTTTPEELEPMLKAQRAAFMAARPEPLSVRRDRIERLVALMVDNADELCAAMSEDFGNRAWTQSMVTDIMATVNFAKYCLSNLKGWAKPEKRKVQFPLGALGGKAELRFEPKGVVGILSPWNFPVNLAFGPLAQVLAAGNRAMLKPSEFTPKTSEVMARLIAEKFRPDEVAVAAGGPDVAQAFSALPFDHLVFTGSTETGRKVMQAAADNLTPVTLELGGKSPVVIGRSADLTRAGERIVMGKMMNAGQICLAPDYLLVPADMEEGVIAALELAMMDQYPDLTENEDYATIITDDKAERLRDMVADAKAGGADVVEIAPGGTASADKRKLPLTIVRNPSDSLACMEEEIFGPVLPIKTYETLDEAIDYINSRDRPLGLYFFGSDNAEREQVLSRTISGGVTVNDVVFHVTAEDLPFGGVGSSGIGAYHGPEGFREFSHARSVFTQPKVDIAGLAGIKPPYGERARKTMKLMLRK
ncbi:coniferyl aldehyde dehydrogenase [Paraurantiacibacter namhicola]|uniref:Aldehyde dehydrogenase n=1 Tax=Paraurantiacibacter namhicola TaxID=645517 RepID=A0A1C7D9F2_9SPHN|nr:coniferyl aldehyde dehydrogenase [Paraurantiacibacter namhicola]ANU08110.1 Coniferyl aldehyde dehydrogenase [Paraurantiacibacter namhicola]